jgi:hypothetical protein
MNEDFLRNMLTKIEYEALVATCLKVHTQLGNGEKNIQGRRSIYTQEMGPFFQNNLINTLVGWERSFFFFFF